MNEINYQLLFKSVPGLYLILSPQLNIVAVSDAYLSATLTKREEIIGRHLFDVFPDNPQDPKADGVLNLQASLNYVLQHRETHIMAVQKYDIRRSDGTFEERWWSPRNEPVLNKNNQVAFIIHSVVDVTQLEKAEERLKVFKHFFDHSTELNCISNNDGHFEIVNPSFEKTLGYSQSELTKDAFLSFVHPDDVPATQEAYDKLKSGEELINFLNRFRKKDGDYLYIEWNATPHPVIGKRYCVARDITERRENELNLQKANAALEAFSYSCAHDLRAPVRAIIGFTKIIQKAYASNFEPDLQELFHHIETGGKRMNAIIDDMLTLAKYEKEKLRLAAIKMDKMVTDVWDQLQLHYPHKATLNLAPLPEVEADKSMIEQVVVNLLSNAIKYSSKKEEPVIEVGYELNETSVTFYVKDNGAGFDMKNYNRLFAPFKRLHSTNEFEGTGVGLMLVKRIVERHSGIVWGEGKVGEGAIFYFTLPDKLS